MTEAMHLARIVAKLMPVGPCPECGGTDIDCKLVEIAHCWGEFFHMQCKCGYGRLGPLLDSKDEAVAAWNGSRRRTNRI